MKKLFGFRKSHHWVIAEEWEWVQYLRRKGFLFPAKVFWKLEYWSRKLKLRGKTIS